jgi:hypothetical protein
MNPEPAVVQSEDRGDGNTRLGTGIPAPARTPPGSRPLRLVMAWALALGACAPAGQEPADLPTAPELHTSVPALESHPPDPVIPTPPELPGTFPPGPAPSPSISTPP